VLVRLFVAVLPPAPVIEPLQALPRPDNGSVRWTTPSQWHVTVRFLGEVGHPSEVVEAVTGAVGSVGSTAVEAWLGPVTAWFPGHHVLQVPVAGLDDIAARVRAATGRWGAPDERPYSGHLTLARTRGREAPPRGLDGAPISVGFTVDAVTVMESALDPGGARYRVVAAVPFGGC
jgi:RNA 2',3'-cyclic 3'-phosphodiesterase